MLTSIYNNSWNNIIAVKYVINNTKNTEKEMN